MLKHVAKLMHEYVAAGQTVHYTRKTRPEWNTQDFHYDFCIVVPGPALSE